MYDGSVAIVVVVVVLVAAAAAAVEVEVALLGRPSIKLQKVWVGTCSDDGDDDMISILVVGVQVRLLSRSRSLQHSLQKMLLLLMLITRQVKKMQR